MLYKALDLPVQCLHLPNVKFWVRHLPPVGGGGWGNSVKQIISVLLRQDKQYTRQKGFFTERDILKSTKNWKHVGKKGARRERGRGQAWKQLKGTGKARGDRGRKPA